MIVLVCVNVYLVLGLVVYGLVSVSYGVFRLIISVLYMKNRLL